MAFSYYSPITVQSGQVPSTQTDFPMLISYTDNRLKTVGNGGHVQNSNGYDIYAYSDSALTTRLPLERERFNASTGEYIGWVKVSSLAVGSIVYLAYGDTGISSDPNSDGTYGATSTWNSGYLGVWHFKDGTTLSGSDSTGITGTATFTSNITATPGQIDGGANNAAVGGGDIMTLSSNPMDGLTAFTVQGWIYGNSTADVSAFWSDWASLQTLFRKESATDLRFLVFWGDGSNVDIASSFYVNATWMYIVVTYDGTTFRTYKNSSAGSTAAASGKTVRNHTSSNVLHFLGGTTGSEQAWAGKADEYRLSNVARSANWITTEYNNQFAPSTFAVLGTEVATSLWTRIQVTSGSNTSFSSTVTTSAFGSNTTVGNILIAVCEADVTSTNGCTVTDNKGNSWTRILSQAPSTVFDMEMWYTVITSGGSSHTVTMTDTGGGVDSNLIVEEWSGNANTPFDVSASAQDVTGISTAPNSGATASTALTDELVIGGTAVAGAPTLTLGSGYTNLTRVATTFTALGFESKVVSATGAQTATFTAGAAGSWACGVATFKNTSAGVLVVRILRRMRLGIG